MIRYRLLMVETALSSFTSFEKDVQARMLRVCEMLAQNPTTRVPGSLEDMTLPEGRVVVLDNFTVVFEVDDAARAVIVIHCAVFPDA